MKALPETVTNFLYLAMDDPAPVAAQLLERGIAVRLLPGALRICACQPEDNERIAQALDEILQ